MRPSAMEAANKHIQSDSSEAFLVLGRESPNGRDQHPPEGAPGDIDATFESQVGLRRSRLVGTLVANKAVSNPIWRKPPDTNLKTTPGIQGRSHKESP